MTRLARTRPVRPLGSRRIPIPPRMSAIRSKSAPTSAMMYPIADPRRIAPEVIEVLSREHPLGADPHHEVRRAVPRRAARSSRCAARARLRRARHSDPAEVSDRLRRAPSPRARAGRAAGSGCRAGSRRASCARLPDHVDEDQERPDRRRSVQGSPRARPSQRRERVSGPSFPGPRAPSRARPRVRTRPRPAAGLGRDRPAARSRQHPAVPDLDVVERDREPDAEDDRAERAHDHDDVPDRQQPRRRSATCSGRVGARAPRRTTTQKTTIAADEREGAQEVEREEPVVPEPRRTNLGVNGRVSTPSGRRWR